ncbi:hypothetical protein BH24ACT5_BH24ACT5_22790 [soil metagenome]
MPPESVGPVPLLSAARVTVVAGKGGVGKTTVTAVLARAAAAAGRRVLVVELDGKSALAELVGDVDSMALSAPAALEEYLRAHGFGRVATRLVSTGVVDVVSTAAPGIDDIVVLGRIKQLERSGEWDHIVVDGPAAGHAVTMLTAAAGLLDAVSGGPIRTQAAEVSDLLHDHERSQVTLVTLPETTPVNELVETAFTLEDRVGVRLSPIVVNAVDVGPALPEDLDDLDDLDDEALAGAAAFRNERRRTQASALQRLSAALPLAQLHVPLVPAAHFDAEHIASLVSSVATRGDS